MFDKKNVYPYYENYNDGNVFIPDEKEQLIISLIRNNAKISLLNLSKKCNIDIKTARNKLNKLYNKNIILGYRALIDTTKLGLYNYHIFFTFDNMNPKKEKRVINFIKKHPYSIEIMQSIGKPDLDCSMLFRNHFDLHMFMKEFRFLFSDIYRNHRFKMITKVYKDT
ncbi:hypothetical protein HN451_07770 [archaeon]|nr:hypothetical protein [archaeon]